MGVTPRRDIDELQEQIQELFNDLWQVPRFSRLRHGFRPEADCYSTDDPPELHVVVELPGVDPGQVQVIISGDTLIVAGVRERLHLRGARVQQMELPYGPFQRQIKLAEDVDSSRATATYGRGLLEIVLPLAPSSPPQARVLIEIRKTP